jgi:hypothetical protein
VAPEVAVGDLRDTIDFTELCGEVEGEALEQLVRALGESLGYQVEWSGRGADQGKDLTFVQEVRGPLTVSIRWLVSCKDLAKSNRVVQESKDLPRDLRGKLQQHDAGAFLLVTTSTVGTAAMSSLRCIPDQTGRPFVQVWDAAILRQLLLQHEAVLRAFLPHSYRRLRELEGVDREPADSVARKFARETGHAEWPRLIPGIPNSIERTQTGEVEELLEHGKPVLIVGEPGTGKSGIAMALCKPRGQPELPVLLLDAQRRGSVRDLPHLAELVDLRDSVTSGIERLARRGGCRLIIDQLDSASADGAGRVFVDLARAVAAVPAAQVVVLSRRRESYERVLLQPLLEAKFIEVECSELSDAEARTLLQRIGVDTPTQEMVELSRNLLNLSMIASIRDRHPSFALGSDFDERLLREAYVAAIRDAEARLAHRPTFGDAVIAEAYRLAKVGLKNHDRMFEIASPPTPEQRSLASWQVVVQDQGRTYRFMHERLQDYLYARDAVDRRCTPDEVVDEIGSLRTRAVFPWMLRLYPVGSPERSEFARRLLDG